MKVKVNQQIDIALKSLKKKLIKEGVVCETKIRRFHLTKKQKASYKKRLMYK